MTHLHLPLWTILLQILFLAQKIKQNVDLEEKGSKTIHL